ncbi:MAG TPA: succinate dehydrogenase, hydrophobic membrane anchor protein [Xanthobacteraceae bacterium]|jgi:succinate dehydrogenase / fumarate reductase membrane anchor subunit|nr:succinate dehydrogenase, hydrophobic membrane anchor protein [Xanthobacteraceae bacterium]
MSMRTPLGRVLGLGSAKSGTEDFWVQRVTAIANVPLTLAGLFLVISLTGHSYPGIKQILGSPLVAVLMILFIIANVWHMKIGVQVVIEDYVHDHLQKLTLVILNNFFAWAVGLACMFAILKISFGV